MEVLAVIFAIIGGLVLLDVAALGKGTNSRESIGDTRVR